MYGQAAAAAPPPISVPVQRYRALPPSSSATSVKSPCSSRTAATTGRTARKRDLGLTPFLDPEGRLAQATADLQSSIWQTQTEALIAIQSIADEHPDVLRAVLATPTRDLIRGVLGCVTSLRSGVAKEGVRTIDPILQAISDCPRTSRSVEIIVGTLAPKIVSDKRFVAEGALECLKSAVTVPKAAFQTHLLAGLGRFMTHSNSVIVAHVSELIATATQTLVSIEAVTPSLVKASLLPWVGRMLIERLPASKRSGREILEMLGTYLDAATPPMPPLQSLVQHYLQSALDLPSAERMALERAMTAQRLKSTAATTMVVRRPPRPIGTTQSSASSSPLKGGGGAVVRSRTLPPPARQPGRPPDAMNSLLNPVTSKTTPLPPQRLISRTDDSRIDGARSTAAVPSSSQDSGAYVARGLSPYRRGYQGSLRCSRQPSPATSSSYRGGGTGGGGGAMRFQGPAPAPSHTRSFVHPSPPPLRHGGSGARHPSPAPSAQQRRQNLRQPSPGASAARRGVPRVPLLSQQQSSQPSSFHRSGLPLPRLFPQGAAAILRQQRQQEELLLSPSTTASYSTDPAKKPRELPLRDNNMTDDDVVCPGGRSHMQEDSPNNNAMLGHVEDQPRSQTQTAPTNATSSSYMTPSRIQRQYSSSSSSRIPAVVRPLTPLPPEMQVGLPKFHLPLRNQPSTPHLPAPYRAACKPKWSGTREEASSQQYDALYHDFRFHGS